MGANYNICGLVVHLAPQRDTALAEQIAALPGIEIHARSGTGRLVVTAADTAATLAIDQIAAIHRMPGVVAASLVYHAFEAPQADTPRASQAIPSTVSTLNKELIHDRDRSP